METLVELNLLELVQMVISSTSTQDNVNLQLHHVEITPTSTEPAALPKMPSRNWI
jgi:hypothetical protein